MVMILLYDEDDDDDDDNSYTQSQDTAYRRCKKNAILLFVTVAVAVTLSFAF